MKIITSQSLQKQAANWGRAGSGILFVCPSDNTVMLMLRSSSVLDPHMWGIPGGAVKGTEGTFEGGVEHGTFGNDELWDSAVLEANQEVYGHSEWDHNTTPGMDPSLLPHTKMVTYDTNPADPASFKYYTFVVEVSPQEKQRMMKAPRNWESTDMKWFPISQLMGKIKPMRPNTGHPVHPEFGKIHNGVAHALHNHPYFKLAPAKRPAKKPPVDPNQPELF